MIVQLEADTIARFTEKVLRLSDDDCWPWLGLIAKTGYGVTRINRQLLNTHRLAWIIAHDGQDIPDKLCICHTCDNRPCCNPRHLFLGTRADNNADMRRKGRGHNPPRHCGEAHPQAKLTYKQVAEIRARYDDKRGTPTRLAREYDITPQQINHIITGQHWPQLEV